MGTNIDEFYDKSTISKDHTNKTSPAEDNSTVNQMLSRNLESNVEQLKIIFDRSFDIAYREFQIGSLRKGILVFIEGFVDSALIDSNVLKPLLNYDKKLEHPKNIYLNEILNFLKNQVITTSQIKLCMNIQEVVEHVLAGDTILLIDEANQAISMNLKKLDKRSIEESIVEPVIRGPRDGFTEDIQTNISLIRRRLKTNKLKMEKMKVGRLSQTTVVISYLDGIVNNSLVKEVQERIARIDIDAVLESGYIEELIEDNHFSVFPQFGYTERPDRLVSALLEGRIGIIIDNTPIALIAPETFFQAMQSSEDYYQRYIPASIIRCLRYFFLFTAFSAPSFYIAVLTFHQGMLPRNLLMTVWASREGIPFPVFIEALMMEVFFEGLREAGIRLPSIAGQTVSIVGALVIGQAAVQAGLVSSSMVITVSITGISSFIIPRFNLALSIRILRFVMMILAGTFGLYGMFIGFLAILIHMTNLRSFGIPYLSPVAPLDFASLKDVFIRAPWWAMFTRPGFMGTKDSKRINNTLRSRYHKRYK